VSRVLVTGAAGFVGRALVPVLVAVGDTVRAAVRRMPSPFASPVETVVHGDLDSDVDWRPLLQDIDLVVHLAGIAHTGPGIAEAMYDRVNHLATAALAQAAHATGIRRLVFVSTVRAQSGPTSDRILTEADDPRPTDAYGRSKLAAEQAVRTSGVPFTILRPVLLYGPGVKGNFAMLARAAASPLPLPVKDFVNRRSMLDIGNFISALQFVLSAPQTAGETYVVADPGMALRLDDMIATLRKAQNRRPFVVPMSTDYVELPLRLLGRGDAWDRIGGNLRADPGKLIAAGWQPLRDTRAGLTAMAQAAAPRKSGTASVSTR